MNVITVSRDYGAGGYEVARRLAEALGGTLSVTSEPGRGSRFVATLPAGP